MRIRLLILALAASLPLLVACSGSTPGSTGDGGGGYRIVTTCGMVTDIVERVAGDRADVVPLMSHDVDPHTYNPTRSDIAKLESADVIAYSGLDLEIRLTDVLTRLGERGRKVFEVTDAIPQDQLIGPQEFEGHIDPHVWNDASLWAHAVDSVHTHLAKFDPEGASGYKTRAEKLKQEILAVHRYAKECLATVPEESRVLVTAHDAFRYFGRAYDLEVHGVQGVTTEHAAGLAEIRALVNLLVNRKIAAIFVEQAFPEAQVRAVVEGAGAKDHVVALGGTLYSDAMGAPGSYQGTYVGMIDHNITLITRALGGVAPEKGLNGKL